MNQERWEEEKYQALIKSRASLELFEDIAKNRRAIEELRKQADKESIKYKNTIDDGECRLDQLLDNIFRCLDELAFQLLKKVRKDDA